MRRPRPVTDRPGPPRSGAAATAEALELKGTSTTEGGAVGNLGDHPEPAGPEQVVRSAARTAGYRHPEIPDQQRLTDRWTPRTQPRRRGTHHGRAPHLRLAPGQHRL